MPTRTSQACLLWGILCLQLACAKPHTLLVSVKFESRRLSDERLRAAAVTLPGQECDLKITTLDQLSAEVLHATPGCDLKRMCEQLLVHDEILHCEEDHEVDLQFAPDDPYLQSCEQWGLTKIEAEQAWDIHRGKDSVGQGAAGGTIVGCMDTGANLKHPDLVGALWTNPSFVNGVAPDSREGINGIHGWDGLNSDGDPEDNHGHGTHTAGVTGAVSNNGVGVAGVAGVQLMILKFMDREKSGSMSVAQILMNYGIQKGARIFAMQFGSHTSSSNMKHVMLRAQAKGVIMVVSGGNDGANNDAINYYPCNYDLENIICCGATDKNDNKASFSNYGPNNVDIFAPGQDIYSTWHDEVDPTLKYKTSSGTSQAAPFVTGVAALVWDLKPNLTWQEVVNTVIFSADVVPGLTQYGRGGGRLNAKRALQAAAANVVPTEYGGIYPAPTAAPALVAQPPHCPADLSVRQDLVAKNMLMRYLPHIGAGAAALLLLCCIGCYICRNCCGKKNEHEFVQLE